MILGAPLLDFNCLFPKPIMTKNVLASNLRPRTADSDLRWKQGSAETISGLNELKRSVWWIRLFFLKIFATENRIDYNSFIFKTPSNLKFLSQLTISDRGPWNSTNRFFSGIDWTNISIHFPISKLRACDYMTSDASQGSRFGIAGHVKMPNWSLLNY